MAVALLSVKKRSNKKEGKYANYNAKRNPNRRSDGGCGRDLDERGERRRAGRGFHHDLE